MNQELVDDLEEILENAISKALTGRRSPQLPISPSPETVHMMAKAATAVYEAVHAALDEEAE